MIPISNAEARDIETLKTELQKTREELKLVREELENLIPKVSFVLDTEDKIITANIHQLDKNYQVTMDKDMIDYYSVDDQIGAFVRELSVIFSEYLQSIIAPKLVQVNKNIDQFRSSGIW